MLKRWEIAPLGNFIKQSKKKIKVQVGVEYPAIGVMMEGKGFVTRPPFVGGVTTYKQLTPIEPNQLVLRSITAWEAPIQVTTDAQLGFHVSGVFPVFDINSLTLNPRFLALLCRYQPFWESMRERCVGSVLRRKTLSPTALMEIPIPVPPLPEQKRIVDLISSVDSYIDALEQQAESARKSRSAVLHEMLSAGGDDWTEITIESVLDFTIGGIWGAEPDHEEVNVKIVRSTEFRSDGVLFYESAVDRSIKNSQLVNRRLIPGDILLEKSGGGPSQPVGRVVFVEEDIPNNTVCSNFVQLVRPDASKIVSRFMFLVLWQWHFQNRTLEFQAQTTGIRNLRTPDYLAQEIYLPPIPEQMRIVDLISSMDDGLTATEKLINETKQLRSGLLSDLLSGKHEIPESYDKVMGAA